MEIQPVSSVGRRVRRGIILRHVRVQLGGDFGQQVRRVRTIPKAEAHVLVAVDDGERAPEPRRRRDRPPRREVLAQRHGALGRVGQRQDRAVEARRAEKGRLQGDLRPDDQVAGRQARETVGLVERGNLRDLGQVEWGHAAAVDGEARQDRGVKGGRVRRSDALGQRAAERVADADDGRELVRGADGTAPELAHQGVEDLELQGRLDRLDGVLLGRGADAEAVVEKDGVARRRGHVDVAVARREVPVAAVEADAVGEDLQLERRRPVVLFLLWRLGQAEGDANVVGPVDREVALHYVRLERRARLPQAHDRLRHLGLVDRGFVCEVDVGVGPGFD